MTDSPAAPAPPPSPAPRPGSFEPLRHPVFAVLWAATVLGNTGTFMRDVASGWLVTDLSASPAAVAAIQAAGMMPIFLLAIPAGVLSDILDRRRFLIAVQILLGVVSAVLMLLAAGGLMTVSSLIMLTFLGGIGAALVGPTWQSIVPELVPRTELRSAVALNSLGINISRAIGPATGGALLTAFGAAVTYGVDVASYAVVVAALLWWKRPKAADDALGERFGGAFRAGLRYARSSRELHVVLARAAIFFAFASAIWALLPLVARDLLKGDAAFYGLLLGSVGAGAIIGAVLMPKLRSRLDTDCMMLVAALLTGLTTAALALSPPKWAGVPILIVMGGAWIIALTTLNATAQSILPNWVRGRALAVYLTVFNGAMACGSLGWGFLAQEIGLSRTLLASAAGLILVGLVGSRLRLPEGEADLTPSNHWPEPILAEAVEGDRGPVLVLIEYRVAREDRAAFLATLGRLSVARRRDGASSWGVSEDAAEPEILVEWFMVESWAEHLRQHKRVSRADAEIQAEVRRFHRGPEAPAVRHLLSVPGR
ncbi:MFS transporter [Ancylobacter pratisalsi]|uniref:MFS transporter n=1 Tax=Ancylobacter pratisalsi TaxID=1745854 RepID=A0A6P1YKE4_9HYPH|nr:MFS transporter [Ancylobacter pratisalsi]QIB33632.1 MFS transporter [Ancylobacter pratisalsi]